MKTPVPGLFAAIGLVCTLMGCAEEEENLEWSLELSSSSATVPASSCGPSSDAVARLVVRLPPWETEEDVVTLEAPRVPYGIHAHFEFSETFEDTKLSVFCYEPTQTDGQIWVRGLRRGYAASAYFTINVTAN